MRRNNGTQALFRVMDDQWRTGKELADLAGVERRTAGQRCMALVREGVAEYRQTGEAPSSWSDRPPREYRRLW
jgi:hypothetical protein